MTAILAVGALAAAGVVASIVVPNVMAQGAAITLEVNSTEWGGPDASPGDGFCRTANNNTTCTLMAAIMEANARPATDTVTIGVVDTIPVGTAMTGGDPTGNDSSLLLLGQPEDRMLPTLASSPTAGIDGRGAMFNITRPMVIDIEGRLQLDASGIFGMTALLLATPIDGVAVFYVNSPGVQILNAPQVLGSGSSFVFAPGTAAAGDPVIVDGRDQSVITSRWDRPDRFAVFRAGAANITVRDYNVKGFSESKQYGAIFGFLGTPTAGAQIANVTIDDVDVEQNAYAAPGATGCNSSGGANCQGNLTNFWGNNDGTFGDPRQTVSLKNLTFKNMTVSNYGVAPDMFRFDGRAGVWPGSTNGADAVTLDTLTIVDNKFDNNRGFTDAGGIGAFIVLPEGTGKLLGTTRIARNRFSRPTDGTTSATGTTRTILYEGGQGSSGTGAAYREDSTAASGIFIENNFFTGYPSDSITLYQTGVATVRGNTFNATASQTTPADLSAEELTDAASLVNNISGTTKLSANQNIATWYPTGTATPASATGTALTATRDPAVAPLSPTATQTCVAQFTVQRGAEVAGTPLPSARQPGFPATLDFYWTNTDDAELYLGSATVASGDTATVRVPLPIGALTLQNGASVTAVTTAGIMQGKVRLQTEVALAQYESSQYSRVISVQGVSCAPVLTINQAPLPGQLERTTARDLHFILTSNVALNPATVTASDFVCSATASMPQAGEPTTIDATRLNPRVVSVTPVAGSNGSQFDVVCRVDDTATVTLTMAANKVEAATAPLTNPAAAGTGSTEATNNVLTFLNPVRVTPSAFNIITGDTTGYSFTIGLATGAPVSTAPLTFTSTVTQAAGAPAVTIVQTAPTAGTANPVIPTAGTTATVKTTAAAGNVTAGTQVPISFTLASADPQYDGLLVPTTTARLFNEDPSIRITKTAYVGMTDKTTLAGVKAGTIIPTDTRLTDGQAVCFVYKVENISTGSWTTNLTGITVTDSDERLGTNGVIAQNISIAAGAAPVEVFACTTLISSDTTTN